MGVDRGELGVRHTILANLLQDPSRDEHPGKATCSWMLAEEPSVWVGVVRLT